MKEDLGSYGLVCLTSVLGEAVEHIMLQSVSKHMTRRSSGAASVDL